ncbi:MAG: [protein-PII] uridylyltransferase [Henriciella sp.]|nr:[protein-PII] uridylyltransferase [Henriciella sp.]
MTDIDLAEHPSDIRPKRAPRPWKISSIIDGRALRIKLTAAALANEGDEKAARRRALDLLHAALFRGRLIAQERLQQGADGIDTARLLAAVQDEVLHALYDYTTTHVIRVSNPTEGERLAVYATGGYGRAVLAPSSDVDLLFIRPYKASAYAESVIEYMLYALWDMGLKVGHAFRTPQECVRLAKEDVTIKTSLLDARFLFGDTTLKEEMREIFNSQAVSGYDAQFIADKLEERDERHARQGNTRYVVEPNVKEGKGGLRDLQTLFWIVKHMSPEEVVTLEHVMRQDVFTDHEYHVFMRAARFLWTVRCHLHYLTGRPEERLSFDLQPELAERMGYKDRGGQLGVERFMKRYFLAAKDVGGLTRILTAKLEESQRAKPVGWRRFLRPGGTPKPLEDERFHVIGGRVGIRDEAAFLANPSGLMKLLQIADDEGLDIHPDAMSLANRNVRLISPETRRDPEMIQIFLDILLAGKDPGLALDRMNETGVLGRFLPEFGGIVAQTQFNMYHHYTVDEHTIRAVQHMAEMNRGEEGFELAETLFEKIKHRRALYLAMLLHDTGKGQGDQQVEGMKTSMSAARRLGLPEEEVELIGWLVGNHLEMSETAQKRDISDPRTLVKFAAVVGDLERLNLLYLLTVADIRAVGPNVWNTWKGQLLGELYHSTKAALRGGRTDEKSVAADLNARAEANRQHLIDQFGNLPPVMLELDEAYWTGFDNDTLMRHAQILAGREETIVRVESTSDSGGTEVFVSGPDRVGLFARLSAAIDSQSASIISAQVFTTQSGRIVDVFVLQDDDGGAFAKGDQRRLDRLQAKVLDALTGTEEIAPVKLRDDAREAAFLVKPTVDISEDESTNYTVIDVAGRDRPGLLTAVGRILAEANVTIVSAHVGSYGERVFDAFYVNTPEDFGAAQKSALKDQLIAALERQEPEAPSTPARKLRRASAADSF